MADLTPRDFDPWQLAGPLQYLTLLDRLGVRMSEVAQWLHVPRSNISMWRHGTKAVPAKHLTTLRERAQERLAEVAELTDKAARLAPSEDVRQALHAEFGALWQRWRGEVLADAGTLDRAILRQYDAMGIWIRKDRYSHEDVESVRLASEALVQLMARKVALYGEAPSDEDALIAQLTQAHAAAAPVERTPADEVDLPDALPPEAEK
jgi:hypothetical protein